jgi:hypothetical protein
MEGEAERTLRCRPPSFRWAIKDRDGDVVSPILGEKGRANRTRQPEASRFEGNHE